MTHPQPPGLAVHCGEQTRIISPSQGEVIIGRGPASAIRLDHSWLSRSHVRLRADDDRWIAADCSSNGMFVDGEKRQSVVVTAGLTMHLGRPDGPAVRFSFVDIVADESEPDEDADPDIARAGAAVAARRRELDLTQRGLARDRIINAGALISFEKGRSWPHESTRTRLEQVLQWPAGAIAGIREGDPSPPVGSGPEDTTAGLPTTVAPALLAQTIQLALGGVDVAISDLPEPGGPDFRPRAAGVLADLRNLQRVAVDAARNSPGSPALALALGGVRRRYHDMMARAAAAPDASVGVRLHVARTQANLTVEDAALAAAVPVSAIEALEEDQPVPAHVRDAAEALIGHLDAAGK